MQHGRSATILLSSPASDERINPSFSVSFSKCFWWPFQSPISAVKVICAVVIERRVNFSSYFSPKWFSFSTSMDWIGSMDLLLVLALRVNVVGKIDKVDTLRVCFCERWIKLVHFGTYLSTRIFCMLVYLKASRTEVHIPITFSFIPFRRQPFKQDERFNLISGHVHRYPLSPSLFLPSDLIYFLNQKQTAKQRGLSVLRKGGEQSKETPQGSLKQPVMGDLNNRKDVDKWDFSPWNCDPMAFLYLSTMCISS